MECHHGSPCPYLNGGDIWHLIGERDYLNQRIDEMERVMALAEAEIDCRLLTSNRQKTGASLYEAIKQRVRHSPCVNADETDWRVDGQNHWLRVFTNKDAALYRIDKSRSSKVVGNILGEKCQGVLISDFYSAYKVIFMP